MVEIEIHPSISGLMLEDVLAASLRSNRLDPKLLYVTPRQAALWREVSLKHSPAHSNPEFSRIYREAYERIAEQMPSGTIHLVGLGPGTGFKEAELSARLQSHGHEVRFTAIDVSRDLVAEAATRVGATGAKGDRHLVCDLAEVEFISGWLEASDANSPRLFTLFGVVPNLEPSFVTELLRGLLRPGDSLLASVHLAPVGEAMNLEAAMKKILPQYDNRETLAWLGAAMTEWKLDALMERAEVTVDTGEKIPCIRGLACWLTTQTVPFQLFFTLRYTTALFEELLHDAGIRGEMLAITVCREEAIWAVRVK